MLSFQIAHLPAGQQLPPCLLPAALTVNYIPQVSYLCWLEPTQLPPDWAGELCVTVHFPRKKISWQTRLYKTQSLYSGAGGGCVYVCEREGEREEERERCKPVQLQIFFKTLFSPEGINILSLQASLGLKRTQLWSPLFRKSFTSAVLYFFLWLQFFNS